MLRFHSTPREASRFVCRPASDALKGVKAFKLLSSSGAYWRGDEKRQMLTRVYGTAFGKKDELKAY